MGSSPETHNDPRRQTIPTPRKKGKYRTSKNIKIFMSTNHKVIFDTCKIIQTLVIATTCTKTALL